MGYKENTVMPILSIFIIFYGYFMFCYCFLTEYLTFNFFPIPDSHIIFPSFYILTLLFFS
jgi:hypothetical protein